MLSEISLSDMNALWDFDTNLGRSFFRRLAMVLEKILYKTLLRLIGLKSMAFSGDFIYGMSDM